MLLNQNLQRGGDIGTLTVWGMWSPLGDDCLLMNANPWGSLPMLGTHSLGLQDAAAPDVS